MNTTRVDEPIPVSNSQYDMFARAATISKNGKVVLYPLDSGQQTMDQDITSDSTLSHSSPYSNDVTIYQFGDRDAMPSEPQTTPY